MREHIFGEFRRSRAPLPLGLCASPTDTFPLHLPFFIYVRSYWRVSQLRPHFPGREFFQDAFNNQIDIFYNLHRRRGSYFRFPYIRFIPPAISFGCSKTESHISLPLCRFLSLSSAKRLETQIKHEERRMSLFRLFS